VTSLHLPHHQQPACIRRLTARLLRENWLQNATTRAVPTTDAEPLIDWSGISSNIIATVLGGAILALAGGVVYIAVQVPRQQSEILYNQLEMKKALEGLSQRMERLELNDRRQDERIIRQEHK
jgi:hypothetical protein